MFTNLPIEQPHMADAADLESRFTTASHRIKSVKNLPTATLLNLYGLYKCATVGPCTAPKPGLLDFTGRAKACDSPLAARWR
ncbi:hypothetical protein SeMB42_g02288 [Synchytrium endobioticum]|uniref:ACB domain-containing protein n=1 Tax=Synchytrium endobioticum TaxID=286115 RepID=A0A507DFC6_9FUNG|nr:hypothetical protein SeMB42_g02288 [Synchytrium endobioticum]